MKPPGFMYMRGDVADKPKSNSCGVGVTSATPIKTGLAPAGNSDVKANVLFVLDGGMDIFVEV